MIKAKLQEILKHVPADATSAMFILGKRDNFKKYKELVIDTLRNQKDLQRAILVFERGISKSKINKLALDIAEALHGEEIEDDAHENIHLMCRAGFTNKEIRQLVKHVKNETKIPVRTWEN